LPDVLLFSSSRVVLAGPAWSWGGGRAVRGSGSDVVAPVNSDTEGIVAPDFFSVFLIAYRRRACLLISLLIVIGEAELETRVS
jgi:hypothetical protein